MRTGLGCLLGDILTSVTVPPGEAVAPYSDSGPDSQLAGGARGSSSWFKLAGLLVFVAILGTAALVAGVGSNDEESYTWDAVKVSGGGWVTGIVPTNSGAVYARTDVGGAYRWDEKLNTWQQLLERDVVPKPDSSDYSVESLAVAPSDDGVVYMAVGATLDERKGRVLRSGDGGRTWRSGDRRFAVNGNADWRQAGGRLAVDPADPDLVYFGSRKDGLWQSSDGGQQWRLIESLPSPVSQGDAVPAGITFLLIDGDKDAGTNDSRTLWAGVEGVGVLHTVDGGASWRLVHPTPGGTPRDAELAADGRLYVTVVGDGPKVVRIGPDPAEVVSIGPGGTPAVIAVDPEDPERVFVADEGVRDGYLWRSRDGGDSWDTLDIAIRSTGAAWPEQSDLESYMSAGDLSFDPARPGSLWFAEGMGVWRSDDLADDELTWTFTSDGIEELVSNDAVKPVGQPLLTAHWDRNIVRHPGSRPAELPLTERFNSAWSLSVAPDDPLFVAAVVDDHRFCCEEDGRAGQSGFSTDGGRTWQRFRSLEDGVHPEDLAFGNIAVSAGDNDNLVWVPSNGGRVHYSRDRGQTWQPSDYPGSEPHFAFYLNRDVLTADPRRPGTFYMLDVDGVLRSTDGGVSWQLRRSDGLPDGPALRFNATLAVVPGSRELLLTTGLLDEGSYPAFRSVDGGDTWTPVGGVDDVGRIGFAAPRAKGRGAQWFVTGTRRGTDGLWTSADAGETWELVSKAPDGRYQGITAITGDPEVPGQVYLGFSGTGFLVGRPR